MKNSINNIKQVMVVYIFLFVALISYIAYFQVFSAPKIAAEPGNPRIALIKNSVLRGTIYDREGNALTTSEKSSGTTQKRTYTQGDLFAHAIGYSSNIYGATSLEAKYDSELTSDNKLTNNFNSLKNDFSFDKLKELFKGRDKDEAKVGNGVVTTLDPAIQKAAYDALGSNKGAVVVLNPKTGEVLGMVSKPTFNPNDLANEMQKANAGTADDSPFLNRATRGMYPPGSTFKTITTASALKNISGITSRTFEDNGLLKFKSGQTLKNAGDAVNGTLDLKNAFRVSSNVVYGSIALELGNNKLKATAEAFGFNNSIEANGFNIDNSIFPTLNSSEDGSIAQSGIGQSSILATPIQMALVASTFANEGKMMEPTIVKEIVDKDKNVVKTFEPKERAQVIDKNTAAIVKDYMENLVNSKVNDSWSYFRGKDVAGKTGTADYTLANGELADPHSWFIGFAPANNPQVALAVIVENGGFGSIEAAKAAGKVINVAVK